MNDLVYHRINNLKRQIKRLRARGYNRHWINHFHNELDRLTNQIKNQRKIR